MYLKSLFLDEFPVLQIVICNKKWNYIKDLETVTENFSAQNFFLFMKLLSKFYWHKTTCFIDTNKGVREISYH